MKTVVCNASPLIALNQIGELELLSHLFERVVVPLGVQSETASSVVLPAWIEVQNLRQPLGARILAASLGKGESETMALALEIGADQVLLDDRAARQLAFSLGLPVAGIVALLVRARQEDLIETLKPRLDALLLHNFRLSPRLIGEALKRVGEN